MKSATSFSKKRRKKSARISNLPRDILNGILGRLPLKDAVKTSILSKVWRYKWVRRAELDFDGEFFTSFNDYQEAKTAIYQVLLLHKGSIMKFTLQGPNVTSCPDIDHWLHFLSKKNVQEFTLHISSDNEYHLPSHFFTFQQLRHLELDMCLFHPPPNFKGFEKLINLHLESVIFDPIIFRNLISNCPLLESLSLHWCTDFHILEIDAANLSYFEFNGTSKSICFKNAPMLRNVTVWLDPLVLTDPAPICSNLTRFFHYMPSLQELDLCGSTLEYLTMGGLPKSPPTALNNVKFLHFSNMSFRQVDEVSGAVYLIKSCPTLQDLSIGCESVLNVVEPVVQFLQAQSMISYGAVKLLERVEMYNFAGFDMEMKFMKFILASAPLLEEISLWITAEHFHRGTQMMDEMKQFRRASANVRFILE